MASPSAPSFSADSQPTPVTPSPAKAKSSQGSPPNAAVSSQTPNKKRKAQELGEPKSEKRLRRFRPEPPQSFHDVYNRARSQRFYVISRERSGTIDCPEETVDLAGSTGNVYQIHIGLNPSCTCPHARKGNQCKHILYVMSRVLRAEFQHVYQLALLSSELRDIFAAAPPIESKEALAAAEGQKSSEEHRRKPIEGDCPICFDELSVQSSEKIVWCRAACGQNIHRDCFETWAKTKRQSEVTCPFCRSVWEGDDEMMKTIKKDGSVNREGYVNVADQLGMSSVRDTSTYSTWYNRSYQFDDDEELDDEFEEGDYSYQGNSRRGYRASRFSRY